MNIKLGKIFSRNKSNTYLDTKSLVRKVADPIWPDAINLV